ncbi:Adipocyte plasma membrane-associated protein [Aphelenchoides besseyi]|nr:Adipocyte plasma membrane-associated protein [Aphelenchoides besseyi]
MHEILPIPMPLTGEFTPNNLLGDPVLLASDLVDGPASLIVEDDTFYTGTADGRMVKLTDGEIKSSLEIVPTLSARGTYKSEPITGRPLGMRRYDFENIVVVDAYLGVYKIKWNKQGDGLHRMFMTSDKKVVVEKIQSIWPSDMVIEGRESRFLNDIEIWDEKTWLLTDSSSRYQLRDSANLIIENAPTGRILHINPNTQHTKVVIDGLYFPTGIQKHPDGYSFLFCETSMFRIRRYYFAGKHKGRLEEFVENLAGYPQSIRLSTQQTFYVALSTVRSRHRQTIVDNLNDWPLIRRLILSFFPNRFIARWCQSMSQDYAIVVEIDLFGNVVRSYQDPDGTIGVISHVADDENHIYIGSLTNKFIAKYPKALS